MKHPRRLLWFLLPAALGIVSVSIGFSAYQLNYIEKNDGQISSSLYSVTFHWEYKDGDTSTDKIETYEGLEYHSGLDLKVLPDEWNIGNTFEGWQLGNDTKATETTTTYTNMVDHSIMDLLNGYSSKPEKVDGVTTIHLWAVWAAS